MIVVRLSEDEVDRARELNAQVQNTYTLRQTKNYVSWSDPKNRRYLIGFLGEIAFQKFLVQTGVIHHATQRADGRADNGDATVIKRDKRFVCDVKTCGRATLTELIVHHKKVQRHRPHIYIAARLQRDDLVELHGAIDFHRFTTEPQYQKMKKMPGKDSVESHFVCKLKSLPIPMEWFYTCDRQDGAKDWVDSEPEVVLEKFVVDPECGCIWDRKKWQIVDGRAWCRKCRKFIGYVRS